MVWLEQDDDDEHEDQKAQQGVEHQTARAVWFLTTAVIRSLTPLR
jgi:hypothetical protein